MKKLMIVLVVFLLSCTSTEKPSKSVPTVKSSHKSKTMKKLVNKALIKQNESEEEVEDKEIMDKKLGYELNENQEKEELNKILDPKNEYTWIEKMWNAFKINRAEDLLKEIDGSKVYRTKESILLSINSREVTENVLNRLAKVYLIQKGEIWIYSELPIKEKLIERGIQPEKLKERFKVGNATVLRLNIEVVE